MNKNFKKLSKLTFSQVKEKYKTIYLQANVYKFETKEGWWILKKVTKPEALEIRRHLNKAKCDNIVFTEVIGKDFIIQKYSLQTFASVLTYYDFNNQKMIKILIQTIIQVLFGCLNLRRQLVLHCDLHLNNILLKEVKDKTTAGLTYVHFIPLISDFESAQYRPNSKGLSNIDFFKTYFTLFYLKKRYEFHCEVPNKLIYYTDCWFFLKSLVVTLHNQSHKLINAIVYVTRKSISLCEKRLLKIFKKNVDDSYELFKKDIFKMIDQYRLIC